MFNYGIVGEVIKEKNGNGKKLNWYNLLLSEPDPFLFVLPEISDDLMCAICMEIMDACCSTSCGHSFCQRCITRAVDMKKECPLCRTNLSHFEVSPNLDVISKINALQVHCRYGLIEDPTSPGMWKHDPNIGCNEIVLFSERENHELNCKFKTV